ncbi:MAG: hypothetical protein HYZ49_01865 [Chloroflexi bacterium]|nr:hypothetical protein [Chloroflexota bacterium]
MYAKNEIMFPPYVIPALREYRGAEWQRLIDRVLSLEEDHPEVLAFCLMMIRLDGCMECETDSYRAMRGCCMCATQTLRRYKGNDRELLKLYKEALKDVEGFVMASRNGNGNGNGNGKKKRAEVMIER